MITLTPEQLGKLLFKAAHEPRRNQKRFIRDLGGDGSAEELDEVLAVAHASEVAKVIARDLEVERVGQARELEEDIGANAIRMLESIKREMELQGKTQSDMAIACGWRQGLVSLYLAGKKEPGIKNLTKMADYLGLIWDLLPKNEKKA